MDVPSTGKTSPITILDKPKRSGKAASVSPPAAGVTDRVSRGGGVSRGTYAEPFGASPADSSRSSTGHFSPRATSEHGLADLTVEQLNARLTQLNLRNLDFDGFAGDLVAFSYAKKSIEELQTADIKALHKLWPQVTRQLLNLGTDASTFEGRELLSKLMLNASRSAELQELPEAQALAKHFGPSPHGERLITEYTNRMHTLKPPKKVYSAVATLATFLAAHNYNDAFPLLKMLSRSAHYISDAKIREHAIEFIKGLHEEKFSGILSEIEKPPEDLRR